MIRYPDGTEAKARDRVRIDHGAHLAVVHAIIDTEDQRRLWGVDGLGLMLEGANYGLVFWPLENLVIGEIEYISRESA